VRPFASDAEGLPDQLSFTRRTSVASSVMPLTPLATERESIDVAVVDTRETMNGSGTPAESDGGRSEIRIWPPSAPLTVGTVRVSDSLLSIRKP